MSLTEATVNPPTRGSRLDADHPEYGVLIPCRLTTRERRLAYCVVQARGCTAMPCERSAELASGWRSLMHGKFLQTARFVPGDHHPGLGQQRRMARVAYALREPYSVRRSKLRCPMHTQVGVIKQVSIFRLPASSESAVGQRPRFSQQRTPAARDGAKRGRRENRGRDADPRGGAGRIGGSVGKIAIHRQLDGSPGHYPR